MRVPIGVLIVTSLFLLGCAPTDALSLGLSGDATASSCQAVTTKIDAKNNNAIAYGPVAPAQPSTPMPNIRPSVPSLESAPALPPAQFPIGLPPDQLPAAEPGISSKLSQPTKSKDEPASASPQAAGTIEFNEESPEIKGLPRLHVVSSPE